MIETADLERRVKEKLATSEERLRLRQDHMRTLMREAEDRQAFYTVTADRLMEEVIRQRVATLKASLDAVATCAVEIGRRSCCLRFAHTVRFPATARMELGVTRDSDAQNLIVQFRASILPIFFPYDGAAELAFPLRQMDAERAAAWADDQLVEFVSAYLRLETDHRYQDDNLVTDPVCGMSVNRAEAPAHTDYDGKTYYFCVQECRDRFLAKPELYVARQGDAHQLSACPPGAAGFGASYPSAANCEIVPLPRA